MEVSNSETYASLLQDMLPNTEVINLSVFGYGYDQMLLMLKEEGFKYHPDIVIIPYLETDKKRNMINFRDYAKPKFVLKNNKLVLTNTPILTPAQYRKKEFFRSKLVDLIKILYRNYSVKNSFYFKGEQAVSRAIFHEMIDTIRQMNAVPIFAYIEGIRDLIPKKEMDAEDKAFFKYWTEQKVPVIYLLPFLNEVNRQIVAAAGLTGKLVFQKRGYSHFSPREHHIIAIGIKTFLEKSGYIK